MPVALNINQAEPGLLQRFTILYLPAYDILERYEGFGIKLVKCVKGELRGFDYRYFAHNSLPVIFMESQDG